MQTDSSNAQVTGVHELPVIVSTPDGASVRVSCFAGRGARANIALFPTLGVEAAFYRGFCQALAAEGYNTLALDLRGHGAHSVRVDREIRFGYRDMVMNDWPAAVRTLRGLFPGLPTVMVGHGVGGHLSALHVAMRPRDVQALILLAAGSAFFRRQPLWQGARSLAYTQFTWSVSELFGYFPGDMLGLGTRESAGVMRDRAHHTRTGDFFPSDMEQYPDTLLTQFRRPVLGVSFSDDPQCSALSTDSLLGCFPADRVTHWHLTPSDLGLEAAGHYHWVRQREVMVRRLGEWLESVLA